MDEELHFTLRNQKANENYGAYIKRQYYICKTTGMLVNNINK